MKKRIANIVKFAKRLFAEFGQDDTFELGAALAYYTIFSIVPLLVVVIAVGGFVVGPDAVRGKLFHDLGALVGTDTAKAVQELLGDAYISGKGWMATVVGLVTLFIGATGIFNSLKKSLNHIWGIEPKPKSSILHFLVSRLLSFSFVMGLGFLLVVTFTLNTLVSGLSDRLQHVMPELGAQLLPIGSFILTVVVSATVFASIFKFLPDVRIPWRDVFPGALFTTALFLLGEFVLGLYFSKADPASTFGAAAGLISLLLWTFYASQTFFLGAEFIYVWTLGKGRPIQPGSEAVKVVRKVVRLKPGETTSKKNVSTGQTGSGSTL